VLHTVGKRPPGPWHGNDSKDRPGPLMALDPYESSNQRPRICLPTGMNETKNTPDPAPTPRPKDAPKRPRMKPRPEQVPKDEPKEAPAPDRGVAPGITG
jgi:hypothetical protein